MSLKSISGTDRRCGFNALLHFFFNEESDEEWFISNEGSPTSAIIFCALLLENKLLPNKYVDDDGVVTKDTYKIGLQFYTMKTILYAYSSFMEYGEFSFLQFKGGVFCFYNSEVAVINISNDSGGDIRKKLSYVKSKTIFVLCNDHWSIFYNSHAIPIPTKRELLTRRLFIYNLFLSCVGSLLPGDNISNQVFKEVMYEADRYTRYVTEVTRGDFIKGIYNYLYMNGVTSEMQQVLSESLVKESVTGGFPINENYIYVKDHNFIIEDSLYPREVYFIRKIVNYNTNLLSHKPINRSFTINKAEKFDIDIDIYKRISFIYTLLDVSNCLHYAIPFEQAIRNSSKGFTVDRFKHASRILDVENIDINKLYTYKVTSGNKDKFTKLVCYGFFEAALNFYNSYNGDIELADELVFVNGDRKGIQLIKVISSIVCGATVKV